MVIVTNYTSIFRSRFFSSLKSFNFVSIANWHWHWWREEKSIKTDCHVKSILDGLFFCQKAHSTKHWRLFELDFSLLKVRFFPGKLHHVTLIFRYFWSLLTHTILLMYSCSCGGSGCSGQVFSQLLFFEVIYISQQTVFNFATSDFYLSIMFWAENRTMNFIALQAINNFLPFEF